MAATCHVIGCFLDVGGAIIFEIYYRAGGGGEDYNYNTLKEVQFGK